MSAASDLILGDVRFTAEERLSRGFFTKWRKRRRWIFISSAAYKLGFHYEEIKALCDGSILIEAASSSPPKGSYVLASPERISAHSAVGETLVSMSCNGGVLLLLKGLVVLAEFSAAQREELCTWLEATFPSE